MKRKFLIVLKETDENKGENCEENGGGGAEDGESEVGQGDEERHPPPPKKARLSTEAERETVVGCAEDTRPNSRTMLPQMLVKTEPTEGEQSNSGISVADSEHCKVEKSSSAGTVSSLPTLSPRATDCGVSSSATAFYPDSHPVPVLSSHCSNCASAKTLCIGFPAELRTYFKNASGNGAFQSLLESVPNILVDVDDVEHCLVVKSFSSTAIERVQMLAEAFVANSRHRQKMLRKREDNSKWSFANFESNIFDANFLVEIEVSLAYLGLAFGRNRSNLAAARALYGIREITVDESQKAQGICKFKIYANTAEAAETARKMLEFTDRKVPVPANAIGRLIGKHSRNVNDIVSKSGVVRLFVEKAKTEEEDKSLNFVLIGTPDTIANAQMMLQFHLRHIRERDVFDEERDEFERECALEKSSLADAASSVAGQRNYDNAAFDHWTSMKAPSADGSASLCSSIRANNNNNNNNNNRLPRPIGRRANRRHCFNGSDGDGWRHGFATRLMSPLLPPPALGMNNNSLCYYQRPLAGPKGQFGSGWTRPTEIDLKPAYQTAGYGRRENGHQFN